MKAISIAVPNETKKRRNGHKRSTKTHTSRFGYLTKQDCGQKRIICGVYLFRLSHSYLLSWTISVQIIDTLIKGGVWTLTGIYITFNYCYNIAKTFLAFIIAFRNRRRHKEKVLFVREEVRWVNWLAYILAIKLRTEMQIIGASTTVWQVLRMWGFETSGIYFSPEMFRNAKFFSKRSEF